MGISRLDGYDYRKKSTYSTSSPSDRDDTSLLARGAKHRTTRLDSDTRDKVRECGASVQKDEGKNQNIGRWVRARARHG